MYRAPWKTPDLYVQIDDSNVINFLLPQMKWPPTKIIELACVLKDYYCIYSSGRNEAMKCSMQIIKSVEESIRQ